MAGGAGRRSAAGHAANAGMNTSGAGGLYPSEACGRVVVALPALDDDLGRAQKMTARRPWRDVGAVEASQAPQRHHAGVTKPCERARTLPRRTGIAGT